MFLSFKYICSWSKYPMFTLEPNLNFPEVGFNFLVIILNKVVLPTPFAPISPTLSSLYISKLQFSKISLSSIFFDKSSTIKTSLPLGEDILNLIPKVPSSYVGLSISFILSNSFFLDCPCLFFLALSVLVYFSTISSCLLYSRCWFSYVLRWISM